MIAHFHLGRCVAPLLAALLTLTASCTAADEADRTPSTARSSDRSDDRSNSRPEVAPATSCPVTIPVPVPRRYPWRASLFGSESSHGNGRLWVGGLGAHGVIAVDSNSRLVDRHGQVGWKLGWWREVPGRLFITGHRLDGAGHLSSDVGTVDEYGPSGFVASSVSFSSRGCWQVTGRVDGTDLSFVTAVMIRR